MMLTHEQFVLGDRFHWKWVWHSLKVYLLNEATPLTSKRNNNFETDFDFALGKCILRGTVVVDVQIGFEPHLMWCSACISANSIMETVIRIWSSLLEIITEALILTLGMNRRVVISKGIYVFLKFEMYLQFPESATSMLPRWSTHTPAGFSNS